MEKFSTALLLVINIILLFQGSAFSSESVVGKVLYVDKDNQNIVLEVIKSSDSGIKYGTNLTVKATSSVDLTSLETDQVVRITVDLTEDSLYQVKRLEPCLGRCGADRTGVRFRLHKGMSGRGALGHGPRYRGRHGH